MNVLCLQLRRRHARRKWSPQKPPPNQRMTVSEDTPPDMLTGQMVLNVLLPSGNPTVKMSVNRRTPMMDLLVQITTAHKLSPAGHVLQPYGENGVLPYKPSTPIGTLEAWTVHVIPKNQTGQKTLSDKSKQISQPFEQTFRLQAYLPRNQMYVTRVGGKTTLGQVLREACEEKNLDPSKYSIRHPKKLDEPLSESITMEEYRNNQVCIVSNKTLPSGVSSDDIMAMQQYNNSRGSSSRSMSPDSSVSPQPPQLPSRPIRKRRPAPKPPVQQNQQKTETVKNEGQSSTVICHSRTSSDSSGYHEASVLSESPDINNSLPDSLPRRSKLPNGNESFMAPNSSQLSKSLGNLHAASTSRSSATMNTHLFKSAQSTSAIIPSRKKKRAPEPPKLTTISPVAEEPIVKSATLPPRTRPPSSSTSSSRVDPPPPQMLSRDDLEYTMADEEIDRIFNNAMKEHTSLESGVGEEISESSASPESNGPISDCGDVPDATIQTNGHEIEAQSEIRDIAYLPSPPMPKEQPQEEAEFDWEYKLPAPPTFRDESSSPAYTEYATLTIADISNIMYRDDKETPEVVKEREEHILIQKYESDVINELSTVILERNKRPQSFVERANNINLELNTNSSLDNFKLTTYSTGAKPAVVSDVASEEPKKSNEVKRRSSLTGEDKERRSWSAVKRSVSHVSLLAKSKISPLSKSNANLLDDAQPSRGFDLRKANSEFNLDKTKPLKKVNFEEPPTDLQSLQVLRSILPQISQSPKKMDEGLRKAPEPERKKAPEPTPAPTWSKPAVSLSTWGERPKRQVSIKSDRDYVFGTRNRPEEKPAPAPVPTPLAPVSPVRPNYSSKVDITSQPEIGRKTVQVKSPSVYKTMETGNTKPLNKILEKKEEDLGRVPIVRAVELKKPYKSEDEIPKPPKAQEPIPPPPPPVVKGEVPKVTVGLKSLPRSLSSEGKFTSVVGIRQNENPVPPPPPPPATKTMLRPVSERKLNPRQVSLDPREELLNSIREFGGRANLRKVSSR